MDDLYGVLIGESPKDADKAAATAAALRRRRSFGELGMLSGDKVLSRYGQNAIGQADEYANRIQQTRQQDIDNAQTRSYQDSQVGHMGSVLAETMRSNKERERLQARGQDMALLAAQARARASNKPPKLTVADRRDLTEGAGLVGNLQDLLSTFKSDYAAPQVMGKSIPMARPLMNTMSSMGVGTEEMDEAQNWWAASDRLYTLFQRNKLFGATLTGNEMKAWAQANANKNMKPEQVKTMLSEILKTATKDLQANVDGFIEGGYDPTQVAALTQRAGAWEDGNATEDPETGMEEEDFGDLTAEEIEELKALREAAGAGR